VPIDRRSRAERLRDWRAERNSAALLGGLAELERNPRQRTLLKRLAEVENRHASTLAIGLDVPAPALSRRTRLLLWIARRIDPALVLPHAARLEQLEADGYLERGSELAADELANAELLAGAGRHAFAEFVKKLILKLRRFVILVVGALLFAVSLLLARNAQLEGLFFGLLTGVVVGPVVHFLLAKLLIPLPLGRIWCGWACWTAAVLDQLPFRHGAGWPRPALRRLRYLHFGLSLTLVLVAVALGFRAGAVGRQAALWFTVGNLVYWVLGVILALALRDNRAFCKVACPLPTLFKLTARPALIKVAGDADACRACRSHACTTVCPMDIRIPDYLIAGERVLSTECILCQQCIAVCPPNTLGLSVAFDLGGKDLLDERAPQP
jgi:ferredoxin